jgi:hypothetical protein
MSLDCGGSEVVGCSDYSRDNQNPKGWGSSQIEYMDCTAYTYIPIVYVYVNHVLGNL